MNTCIFLYVFLAAARASMLRNIASIATDMGVESEVREAADEGTGQLSEMSTDALLSRYEKVKAMNAVEASALEAQQQAIVSLKQMNGVLTQRLDALEATAKSSDFLCSRETGGTCSLFPCDQRRGKVLCEHGACICEPGICADGHGRCLSSKKARVSPGTYTIEFKNTPGQYLFMRRFASATTREMMTTDADDHQQGLWRIVVNNDDSIMLFTQQFGPEYFLSVEKYHEYCNDVGWCSKVYRPFYKAFASPWNAAFQLYQDKQNNMYMKYIPKIDGWLDYDSYGGPKFPGVHGALVFHPPLTGVVALEAPSSAKRSHTLLVFLLIAFAALV